MRDLYERILGVGPDEDVFDRLSIKMVWLNYHFGTKIRGVGEYGVQHHAHGYMLRLLSERLCPDKTMQLVHTKFLPLVEDRDRVGSYN